MPEDAPVNTGAVAWPQCRLGLLRGTGDADQVAPLGGRGFLPPVR